MALASSPVQIGVTILCFRRTQLLPLVKDRAEVESTSFSGIMKREQPSGAPYAELRVASRFATDVDRCGRSGLEIDEENEQHAFR